MAHILLISASPNDPSRTDIALDHIAARLREHEHTTQTIWLRDLPAEPLLHAHYDHPAIAEALDALTSADGLVIGSPVYKASYSGLLKVFLDLLPMKTLTGVPVLPILTGGSPAHVLALDFAFKPLLSALGANRIDSGRFIHSSDIITATGATPAGIGDNASQLLDTAIEQFSVLARRAPANWSLRYVQ